MKYTFPVVITGVFVLLAAGALSLRLSQRTGVGNPAVPTTTPASAEKPAVQPVESAIMLSVTSPANGSTVKTPTITVKGKTVPKAEVWVNDQDVRADASGNFSATVTLDEGENTITVTANDDDGNASEKEITVNYEPAS